MTLALAAAPLGCATDGDPPPIDPGEVCAIIVFGIFAIPCAIAGAAGCVTGGVTRCAEGPPPQPDDAPPPATAEAAPAAPTSAAMEF